MLSKRPPRHHLKRHPRRKPVRKNKVPLCVGCGRKVVTNMVVCFEGSYHQHCHAKLAG